MTASGFGFQGPKYQLALERVKCLFVTYLKCFSTNNHFQLSVTTMESYYLAKLSPPGLHLIPGWGKRGRGPGSPKVII